ncbi:MAG: hypothetical protein HQ538_03935 [Parcubacteria group bacterium]|nr:hypothetical protein [Parcubacteria group bacterium]
MDLKNIAAQAISASNLSADQKRKAMNKLASVNANVNINTQNNSNYAVQNKSFNIDNGNSKTANTMKSGARNLSGGSFGQKKYSNANPNMFSQKAQPTKIGNGIDTNLAKGFIKAIVNILFLIIFLGVVYYVLVNYLGMSVSVG